MYFARDDNGENANAFPEDGMAKATFSSHAATYALLVTYRQLADMTLIKMYTFLAVVVSVNWSASSLMIFMLDMLLLIAINVPENLYSFSTFYGAGVAQPI
jgi:hypothetical protein